MLNVNINRVLLYWIVRTSNAVSIDIVLGDKPIVVTPSANAAWHGIVMQLSCIAV